MIKYSKKERDNIEEGRAVKEHVSTFLSINKKWESIQI